MKTVISWILAVVVVAGIAWTVTYFFWHVRIVSAVATLESKGGTPAADDAADIVESAGCRALPYLVAALDHQKNQHFQILASKAIVGSIQSLGSRGELADPALAERAKEWVILAEDTAPTLRIKCDALQGYWRDHGPRHHKSWRVWTSNCGP